MRLTAYAVWDIVLGCGMSGTIRILFAFDPRRAAILLLGGDKRDRWQEFYVQMIPLADQLFDEHLAEIESEGAL